MGQDIEPHIREISRTLKQIKDLLKRLVPKDEPAIDTEEKIVLDKDITTKEDVRTTGDAIVASDPSKTS